MGQIELSAVVASSTEPRVLITKLCELATTAGVKAVRVSDNQADFRRGSQASLRLKGGLIAKVSDFPVLAVVRADEVSGGSSVFIRSLDDLGFGLRAGMKTKYTEAVRQFGELLASIVRSVDRIT